MIVGILVIVLVLVLRNMDQKRQMEERQKAGQVSPGPASFETLKRTLGEISERLTNVENDYQQLARRMGVHR
jgi:hypothetical protein